MTASELTLFAKSGGPLTKRISLCVDGSLRSDGSACVMAHGEARRACIAGIADLGALIERLQSNEAIALGALRPGLADPVKVVTKAKLNGAAPNVIARTAEAISYRKGRAALALLDFDTKGMPSEVTAKLRSRGGFWGALVSVVPELAGVAHLTRRSTSAGLFRGDNGKQLPGSDGVHVYVAVQDGTDIERFLRDLHARCFLTDLGWLMVGAGGQLLERSIVDRMVGAPERLVFEGGPILDPPLRQDKESRRPVAVEGDALDTLTACPPLTVVEQSRLNELRTKWKHRLAGDADKVRRAFIAEQTKRLAAARGISEEAAARIVARQCEGVLLPGMVLPFDDPELVGCTVADVLADPDKFEGATLADPLEGVEYGTGKARVMCRADGSVWIHSFAHGRTVYALKLDTAAARAALEKADKSSVVKLFIKLALAADLDAVEIDELRQLAAKKAKVGLNLLKSMLKKAEDEQDARRRKEKRDRELAARTDPRPRIDVPASDAPWIPQMDVINSVLGVLQTAEPPSRNIDTGITRARKLALPGMHAFDQSQANPDVEDET
jgi:hypothetical protein